MFTHYHFSASAWLLWFHGFAVCVYLQKWNKYSQKEALFNWYLSLELGDRENDLMAEVLQYSPTDFNLCGEKWTTSKEKRISKFDTKLCAAWDTAMENGHFRYDLSDMKTRMVPGKIGYVTELNLKRGSMRRKPDNIQSVNTPFDSEKFNFTKVKLGEVLFEVIPQKHVSNGSSNGTSNGSEVDSEHLQNGSSRSQDMDGYEEKHLIMINVSPLEYGHILLVPDVNAQKSQMLTLKSVELGIEMFLLSNNPAFRVAFNSLCAFASVNHQHLHAWYVEYKLPVENTAVEQLMGECYRCTEHPTGGFAFQLHGNSVDTLAKNVYYVADYLQKNDIAHNMFITRGSVFNDPESQTTRVFIWPRMSTFGAKFETHPVIFNVAVAELAGHLPIYDENSFESLDEEYINKRLAEVRLPEEDWMKIECDIKKLFTL